MFRKFTAIDLEPELGGRTLALSHAGFDVTAVTAADGLRTAKFYRTAFPQVPLLETDETDYLPPADLLAGRMAPAVSLAGKRAVYAEKLPLLFSALHRIMPKAFLIQTSAAFLQKMPAELFEHKIRGSYSISYRVCDGIDFSGFPVKSVQAYIVGLRWDVAQKTFQFPHPEQMKTVRLPFLERADQVDPWYRQLPARFTPIGNALEHPYFYADYTGKVRGTDLLYLGRPQDCYLRDELGIRRLTHAELALLKGYPESWHSAFSGWSSRRQMYQLLQSAPDLYILRPIVQELYRTLDDAESQTVLVEMEPPPPLPIIASAEVTVEAELTVRKPVPKAKAKRAKDQRAKDKAEGSLLQPRIRITNLRIDRLKGLKDVDIPIQRGLTAIMGVNGAGKSTVLHALACMFSPPVEAGKDSGKGENYKFPFFFTPNPDASWQGSRCRLTYFDENTQSETTRTYEKIHDRWMPHYDSRPKRHVFYLGISSGLPEIEREHQTSYIDYATEEFSDKLSGRIISAASEIMQKDYQSLTSHRTHRKELIGVHTASGITYSSLSMGAGEQRLVKILTTVFHAEPYSLILIDEIDLLLHCNARKRLIRKLSELAERKNLQIVFTTHSQEIGELAAYTGIRYLYHTREKTLVYDHITPDIVYDLSRELDKPLMIYVEDDVAQAAVSCAVRSLGLSRCVEVRNIGSIENAFTLAAGLVLDDAPLDQRLIVLDGDRYRTEEERLRQIERRLSGTEAGHEDRVRRAASVIRQFTLPENTPPEKFLHSLLSTLDGAHELSICAREIRVPTDSHGWLDEIVRRMGQDRYITLHEIMERASDHTGWGPYVEEIRSWLLERASALNLKPIEPCG